MMTFMKKKFFRVKQNILVLTAIILFASLTSAQFIDNFNDKSLKIDPNGINGWTFRTGDGMAAINFSESGMGYATINVNATKDKHNIWWAIIRRCVSQDMDLSVLSKPNYEFCVEARIKSSSAPKRVSLHLNTQRTTDFHSHLMEYDIPDTSNWHTISMTTHNFDAEPGDTVYAQLALMDWGLKKYQVNVDYLKVDIVNTNPIEPEKGVQVPYHRPIMGVNKFDNHLSVAQDGMVDLFYTDMNFNNWVAVDENGTTKLLTVSGTQLVIMRWDLSEFAGKQVKGSGLLELTTYSLQRSPDYQKDFGMIRVSEIIGGEKNWDQEAITYDNLCAGQPLDNVINSQMIIDVEVNEKHGEKNFITISNPVLQRMIESRTLGLAIRPLGAVIASFYSMENEKENFRAELHFNIK